MFELLSNVKKQRLVDLGQFLTQNSMASQEALEKADSRIKQLEVTLIYT